jgi:hypothetical protein
LDEPLFGGIPVNLASKLDRNIRQVTKGGYPVTDLDWEVRVSATLDALEEVMMFPLRIRVESGLFRADFSFENCTRACL